MTNLTEPFEISFRSHPRARQRQTVVRFGESMEATLATFKEDPDVRRDWPRMSGLLIRPAGQEADGYVGGVLRGGRVFGKRFYCHTPRQFNCSVDLVRDLTIY